MRGYFGDLHTRRVARGSDLEQINAFESGNMATSSMLHKPTYNKKIKVSVDYKHVAKRAANKLQAPENRKQNLTDQNETLRLGELKLCSS